MNVKPELLKKNRLSWMSFQRLQHARLPSAALTDRRDVWAGHITKKPLYSFIFFFAEVDEYESFCEKSEMLV